MLDFFSAAKEFLGVLGVLFDPSYDLFRHLVQEDFLVLFEGLAFVGFAARTEEVSVLTNQIQLPLLGSLHLAFTNLDTPCSLSEVSFQELALENDGIGAVDLPDHAPARHLR